MVTARDFLNTIKQGGKRNLNIHILKDVLKEWCMPECYAYT